MIKVISCIKHGQVDEGAPMTILMMLLVWVCHFIQSLTMLVSLYSRLEQDVVLFRAASLGCVGKGIRFVRWPNRLFE